MNRPVLLAITPLLAVPSLATVAAATPPAGTSGDQPAASTAPPADAYPLTIEHRFGTVELSAPPERVVSLGYTEQDAIVAFGIEPIAVRYAFGPEDDVFFPWADEAAGDADPAILPRAEVNVEQIAALDPDLIMAITAGLDEPLYQTLSGIAPVIVQPEGYDDFATPWQVQTALTGEVFGQADRAAELIAETEGLVEAARRAHPEFDGLTLALSGPAYDGQYPFHASGDARTRFFVDLGFVVPDELDAIAGDQFYGALSMEQAELLDTDVLVWQAGSPEERAGIEDDPILAALPVATDGRAVFIEGRDYDALQFMSVLSLPYLVDGFVPLLADAAARVG